MEAASSSGVSFFLIWTTNFSTNVTAHGSYKLIGQLSSFHKQNLVEENTNQPCVYACVYIYV